MSYDRLHHSRFLLIGDSLIVDFNVQLDLVDFLFSNISIDALSVSLSDISFVRVIILGIVNRKSVIIVKAIEIDLCGTWILILGIVDRKSVFIVKATRIDLCGTCACISCTTIGEGMFVLCVKYWTPLCHMLYKSLDSDAQPPNNAI